MALRVIASSIQQGFKRATMVFSRSAGKEAKEGAVQQQTRQHSTDAVKEPKARDAVQTPSDQLQEKERLWERYPIDVSATELFSVACFVNA